MHGTVGAARRRRNRRLRAFLKHERMTVAMNLATLQHHSFMKSAVVDVGVQVGSPCALTTTSRLLKSLTVNLTKRPLWFNTCLPRLPSPVHRLIQ